MSVSMSIMVSRCCENHVKTNEKHDLEDEHAVRYMIVTVLWVASDRKMLIDGTSPLYIDRLPRKARGNHEIKRKHCLRSASACTCNGL